MSYHLTENYKNKTVYREGYKKGVELVTVVYLTTPKYWKSYLKKL